LIGYELHDRLVPFLTEKASDFPDSAIWNPAGWRSFDLVEMSANNHIVPPFAFIACTSGGIPVPAWDWHGNKADGCQR
jgi:hypothetical protein